MPSTDDNIYLNELNEAQRAAVCDSDGPSLVIAGAGSGKTRVLVYKLLHLLGQGYAPYRIMALTFTNKAAREMRSRIQLLAGDAARYIQMGTFHSVFLRILRSYADRLGYTPSFSIYNTTDSRNRIRAIIKLLSLDDSQYRVNAIHSRISNAKNYLLTPEAYRASSDLIQADVKAGVPRLVDIYTRYWYDLKQSNAMDFDDILLQMNILLRDHPDALAAIQERVEYLLIDEYQDTNLAQYNIARLLMQERGNIFVVGDDAQSIYSFRGANIKNILNFQQAFPGARIFKLEQNFRSSQTIVKAADKVIGRNEHQIPKQVFSLGEVGEPIELHEAITGDLEATWVCKRIEERRRKERAGYDQFAVLYRTNAQSRALEQVFRRQGIPFRIWGGRSFYDHKEVMDTMAYLRLVTNPTDEEALLRIINYPKRGIGDTTLDKLRVHASEHACPIADLLSDPIASGISISRGTAGKLTAFDEMITEMRQRTETEDNLYDLAQWILSRSGILTDLSADTSIEGKGRIENIRELLTSIEEYDRACREEDITPSLGAYISEVALMTDQDTQQDEQPSVTLMTIHAAKGLEFPHVFIVGLEEMLFPSAMSSDGHHLEEERRLFYVALTRAEKTCYLGYAQQRFRNGRTESVRPSRFLYELPEELLRRTFTIDGNALSSSFRSTRQADELPQTFRQAEFLPREDRPTPPPRGKQVHLGRRSATEEETRHEQIGSLRVGSLVLHGRFGEGEIILLEGDGENAKATVRFEVAGEKKLLLRFANLILREE